MFRLVQGAFGGVVSANAAFAAHRRPDQQGRALSPYFALAALGCAAAVALQGAAIEPELLVPLRSGQGFCFAALAQSVLYVVARLAPEVGKGSCLGLANGVVESGQIVGPLLGSLAATLLPLPVVFAAIDPLFAAAALAAFSGRHTQVGLPDVHRMTARLA